jgi:selenide,water dikinase
LLDWQRKMMTDPQTSGGVLVACAAEAEREVLDVFRKKGFGDARVIGRLSAGEAKLTVR